MTIYKDHGLMEPPKINWKALIGWAAVAAVIVFGVISGARADTLGMNSVARLQWDGDNTCTVSKIAAKTFLTASHCVKGTLYKPVFTVSYQGTDEWPESRKITSITVGTEEFDDWAVLKTDVDLPDMDALPVNCAYEPEVGDLVTTVGYPAVMGKSFHRGYVSSLEETSQGKNVANFYLDIKAAPGASGSPILKDGAVVGILSLGIVPNRFGLLATGIHSVDDACGSYAARGPGSIHIVDPERDGIASPF